MNAYAPVIHMFPAIIWYFIVTPPVYNASKFHANTVLDRNQLLVKYYLISHIRLWILKSSHIYTVIRKWMLTGCVIKPDAYG